MVNKATLIIVILLICLSILSISTFVMMVSRQKGKSKGDNYRIDTDFKNESKIKKIILKIIRILFYLFLWFISLPGIIYGLALLCYIIFGVE